jgi:pyruvate formate lyase activating enzyme
MEGFRHLGISRPQANADEGLVGYVHSVETGAAVDGPGLRYLLFMAGCAFRCLYCHNPDTWKIHAAQKQTVGELLSDIGKYAPFLYRTGGLTISGGKPLTQAAFVGELFRQVKKELKLHNALDTQGNLAHTLPDAWFAPVDLVLLDIKHIRDDRHRELTGFPLGPSLDCARRLSAMGKDLWIRHVIVPGWTDGIDDLEELADFVAGLKSVSRVELLPFHQLGAHKWRTLGLRYRLADTKPPSPELMASLRAVFQKRGIETA